jgi:steroid delta-isomerase
MSPKGRPEGEYRSAQHEGTPVSAKGRPEREHRSAQREGGEAPALPATAAARRLVAFYENLAPADLARLGDLYAPNAYFRDPFNEVRGVEAIERIFADMFENLDDCRFRIVDTVVDERGALLTWDFTFRIRRFRPRIEQRIHGASHLRFDAAGRVSYHRDYWDAAEELYAKLPLIGPVIRWLKRRLG